MFEIVFNTIPVANWEEQRLFSLICRVQNELRTDITQSVLNLLSVLLIEGDIIGPAA